MKSMAKMKYHYGLKMRCYPSDQQKQLLKSTVTLVALSITKWLRSIRN